MNMMFHTVVINQIPVLRARQKPLTRGATRREASQKTSLNWSRLGRFVSRASLLLALFTVLGVAGYGVHRAVDVPVSRVAVNGEFRQVDKQLIIDRVQPFLGEGFLRLDLDAIRQRLRSEPWIFDVSISRRWPNEIAIAVEEQSVIARWGEHGFLNYRGELFIPETVNRDWIQAEKLPLLNGPQESSTDVMNHFRELNDTLSQHGLNIRELGLNEHGGWYATLDNGIDMYLGSGDIMQKMRRFLVAYRSVLASQFYKAKSVDMRYNGGFAVAWRDAEQ